MNRILFVEDSEDLAFAITESLSLLGNYEITKAYDGEEGLKLFHEIQPDVVISDVEMPKMNGFELATAIRKTNKECIIFLATGLTGANDIVHGFEIGIDDYVKKPYSAPELHARLQLIHHRSVPKTAIQEYPYIGKYQFDTNSKSLIFNNETINLTGKEFAILKLLFDNKEQLVSKQEIMEKFWGESDFFNSRSLDVFINKLRKYLSNDKNVAITTTRGKGLKLTVQ